MFKVHVSNKTWLLGVKCSLLSNIIKLSSNNSHNINAYVHHVSESQILQIVLKGLKFVTHFQFVCIVTIINMEPTYVLC